MDTSHFPEQGLGRAATLITQGSRTEKELKKPERITAGPWGWPSHEREREQVSKAFWAPGPFYKARGRTDISKRPCPGTHGSHHRTRLISGPPSLRLSGRWMGAAWLPTRAGGGPCRHPRARLAGSPKCSWRVGARADHRALPTLLLLPLPRPRGPAEHTGLNRHLLSYVICHHLSYVISVGSDGLWHPHWGSGFICVLLLRSWVGSPQAPVKAFPFTLHALPLQGLGLFPWGKRARNLFNVKKPNAPSCPHPH